MNHVRHRVISLAYRNNPSALIKATGHVEIRSTHTDNMEYSVDIRSVCDTYRICRLFYVRTYYGGSFDIVDAMEGRVTGAWGNL